jgi:uncharacterized protein YkwD
MSWIRLAAVVTFLGCLLVFSSAEAQAGRAERVLVSKINHVRAANGLRALRVSKSLNRSSRSYVHLMLRRHYFGHASRIMMSGRFHRRGEILAQNGGRHARPGAALAQWLASPIHRSVMLDGAFRYIGVGKAYGSFGGSPAMGWVAQFGS